MGFTVSWGFILLKSKLKYIIRKLNFSRLVNASLNVDAVDCKGAFTLHSDWRAYFGGKFVPLNGHQLIEV